MPEILERTYYISRLKTEKGSIFLLVKDALRLIQGL